MNIAVLGATGSIGPVIAHALVQRGHTVRTVARNVERLRATCPGTEALAADLAVPAQARAALAGIDCAIFTVGLPYQDFAQYPPLTRNAVAAARAAGVKQFLLFGTVYPWGRARTPRITEDAPREPHTRKGRARNEQLNIVLDAHDATFHTAAIVLPDFYGPQLANTYTTAVFEGAVSGKAAAVIGPIDKPHEFVYVPDTGPMCAQFVDHPEAFDGTAYFFGGAGTIVPRAMYEQAYADGGHKPRFTIAGLLMQRILGIAMPQMRELAEMNYLWTDPVVLDDAKLARVIGPLHKTPYADGIRAAVDAARPASA